MTALNEIWIGMLEVRAAKNATLLEDADGAFVNVLAWASSDDEFREKARELMEYLHLDLVKIENPEPLTKRGARESLEEGIAQIAEEMESTPDAIRYSTFHTWTDPIH